MTPETITNELAVALAPHGFDIVRPFNICAYNAFASANPRLPKFPDFGRGDALACLIGNTKAAWELFLADYKARYGGAAERPSHPFDQYTEIKIDEALKNFETPYQVRFGHHDGDQFVSLLHASEASLLAKISPARLALHPEYGLWFALRAVAVFDCQPPIQTPEDWVSPCLQCAAPCARVSRELMARHNDDWLACTWQERLTVRDACPVGLGARYSDAQARYHYSRDITLLESLD